MTHSLAHFGAAHDAAGKLLYPARVRDKAGKLHKNTKGEGRGKCSGCGQLSKVLPNGASRRRWFEWHEENAPEPTEYPEVEVPFTRSLAKNFWASLAVNGTRCYLETEYPMVTLRADYDAMMIYLSSPDPNVTKAAVESIRTLWEDAAAEFYLWKRNDPVYLSLQHDRKSNRRASYKLTKKFFIDFCTGY